jgi:hypothetical protein
LQQLSSIRDDNYLIKDGINSTLQQTTLPHIYYIYVAPKKRRMRALENMQRAPLTPHRMIQSLHIFTIYFFTAIILIIHYGSVGQGKICASNFVFLKGIKIGKHNYYISHWGRL